MDWARAIEINQTALTRIVAALIAMAGLAGGGVGSRLSRPTYRAVLGVLRPAESAVRRLIVIAARGLKALPAAARPMPAGLAFAHKRGGRVSFQLFDGRKRFRAARSRRTGVKTLPCISVWQDGELIRLPLVRPVASPVREPDGDVDAARLGRRLAAVRQALETLPRQAKRLARWQARRDRMRSPRFTSPLRPGPPPGRRKKPRDEVHFVLRECHALARDALNEDTS